MHGHWPIGFCGVRAAAALLPGMAGLDRLARRETVKLEMRHGDSLGEKLSFIPMCSFRACVTSRYKSTAIDPTDRVLGGHDRSALALFRIFRHYFPPPAAMKRDLVLLTLAVPLLVLYWLLAHLAAWVITLTVLPSHLMAKVRR